MTPPPKPIDIFVEVDDASRPELAAKVVIEIPKENANEASVLYDNIAIAAAILSEHECGTLDELLAALSVVCRVPGQLSPRYEPLLETVRGRLRLGLVASSTLIEAVAEQMGGECDG